MKKLKFRRALTTACSLALALTPFFYYNGASLIFFGEPKHPDAK